MSSPGSGARAHVHSARMSLHAATPPTSNSHLHDRVTVVFGASGYVGTNLVARLLREGRTVRAAGRNRKVLEARGWTGVEIVEADALRPETLAAALDGVDVAYYLVHSMAAGRDFGHLDR